MTNKSALGLDSPSTRTIFSLPDPQGREPVAPFVGFGPRPRGPRKPRTREAPASRPTPLWGSALRGLDAAGTNGGGSGPDQRARGVCVPAGNYGAGDRNRRDGAPRGVPKPRGIGAARTMEFAGMRNTGRARRHRKPSPANIRYCPCPVVLGGAAATVLALAFGIRHCGPRIRQNNAAARPPNRPGRTLRSGAP